MQANSRRQWLFDSVRPYAGGLQALTRWIWPPFDVALRFWIAKLFLISGMVQAMHIHGIIDVGTEHNLGDGTGSFIASGLGSSLELLSGILFLLGFFTRVDALALLLLSNTGAILPGSDTLRLVRVLLVFYWLGGAGPLSLDHLLGGIASSAFAFAKTPREALAALRRRILPLFLAALRGWLAISLLTGPLTTEGVHSVIVDLAYLIPASSAPPLTPWLCWVVGTLLLIGLGTRLLAIVLLISLSTGAMMGWHYGANFYWALMLGLVTLQGPGSWSIDAILKRWLRRAHPELAGGSVDSSGMPRVVIVGAGFGGLSCAKSLRRLPVEVTLVDRANHHLFQPLLYQVATASLSPGDIAAPIRSLFREASNIRVVYGAARGIDTTNRVVQLDSTSLPYDYLVLATGATHGYFGHDAWRTWAPGLKRLEDATEIRRRLFTAFERAELAESAEECRALLTFLVVGGGPTGVELAGAIAELTRLGMERDFRRFEPSQARIILVQSGGRILPSFPESLSRVAQLALERLGVEVLLESRVEMIDQSGVSISGERIAARTVLWAAGVVASPAGAWLGAECDSAGRVVVGSDLSVPGMPNVFAVGDTAASKGWAGANVPGLAPAAKQEGVYVARTIDARISGHSATRAPFRYRHWGSLAAIGRKAAVVDFGHVRLWGAPAWWLWGILHIGLLVGVRNRIATAINWFCSYITFRSAVRLITGGDASS